MTAKPLSQCQHVAVVRQEHLNQYGNLFGGYLLQIIDELAFIAAVRAYPDHNFVTRAINNVQFHVPARLGDIIETIAELTSIGNTSCRVHICVYVAATRSRPRRLTFDGEVVLVCVDNQGQPIPVEPASDPPVSS